MAESARRVLVVEDDGGVRELMARIRALMRRHRRQMAEQTPTNVRHAGDLTLDRERRQAIVRGERVELTKQEFDLLFLLASRPGTVFTRAALLEEAWATTRGRLSNRDAAGSLKTVPVRPVSTGVRPAR